MLILFIIILTSIFLSLLMVMYIYLLSRKIINHRYSIKKQHWIKDNWDRIYTFLTTGIGEADIKPVKAYQFDAYEDLFSDILANYKLDEDTNYIQKFVDKYFTPHYSRRLKHHLWSTRMNTLFFIDLFHMKSMEELLIQHLSDKRCSPEEKVEIFIQLASFNYDNMVDLLKDVGKLPTFLLHTLVGRLLNIENVDQFVDDFEQFDIVWRGAILEIIRDKNLRTEKTQQLLERLIHAEHAELRVKSLKTLASLGYISSINAFAHWVEQRLASDAWNDASSTGERLMTARLMGNIRDERFIPLLETMLGDRMYSIRSEAAKSIKQYRGGNQILTKLSNSHIDSFARSICQEWLERSQLEYE